MMWRMQYAVAEMKTLNIKGTEQWTLFMVIIITEKEITVNTYSFLQIGQNRIIIEVAGAAVVVPSLQTEIRKRTSNYFSVHAAELCACLLAVERMLNVKYNTVLLHAVTHYCQSRPEQPRLIKIYCAKYF